jgi:hypothetical protein
LPPSELGRRWEERLRQRGGGDGHLDVLGEPAGDGVGRELAIRVIQKRCRTSLARVRTEERLVRTE